MALKPIEICVVDTEGAVYVAGPELLEQCGLVADDVPGLKLHTITLAARFTQAMQAEVERGVLAVNPLNGQTTVDETRRAGAMVEQYVEAWDFTDEKGAIPANADGYNRLHPLVAAELRNRLAARVFPSLAVCPDFISALLKKQREQSSSEKNLETPASGLETPQAA